MNSTNEIGARDERLMGIYAAMITKTNTTIATMLMSKEVFGKKCSRKLLVIYRTDSSASKTKRHNNSPHARPDPRNAYTAIIGAYAPNMVMPMTCLAKAIITPITGNTRRKYTKLDERLPWAIKDVNR
jgi:hypothetical protein